MDTMLINRLACNIAGHNHYILEACAGVEKYDMKRIRDAFQQIAQVTDDALRCLDIQEESERIRVLAETEVLLKEQKGDEDNG